MPLRSLLLRASVAGTALALIGLMTGFAGHALVGAGHAPGHADDRERCGGVRLLARRCARQAVAHHRRRAAGSLCARASVGNAVRVVRAARRRQAQGAAGLRGQAVRQRARRAAAPAHRAQRRHLRGRDQRRPRARAAAGRGRRRGEPERDLRQRAARPVRHRVLSGRQSAMGLCRQHGFGGPLRLPGRRPEGARRARNHRGPASGRRRPLDARHRLLEGRHRGCSSRSARPRMSAKAWIGAIRQPRRNGSRTSPRGAAWGNESERADVLVFDPQGKGRRIFATGIRNCVGLAVNPTTGDLWCSTNERDGLGDNLPPDYITRVREGGFYGWPWYYIGAHEDPRHRGERPDLKDKITVPDVLIQPHSASLAIDVLHRRPVPGRATRAASSRPSTAPGTGRRAPATRSSARS